MVGKSGSGKSTIAKLLFQFYKPNQNSQMLLDGHDFNQLDYHWLRENMAMVPQDPELFADTIRYFDSLLFRVIDVFREMGNFVIKLVFCLPKISFRYRI